MWSLVALRLGRNIPGYSAMWSERTCTCSSEVNSYRKPAGHFVQIENMQIKQVNTQTLDERRGEGIFGHHRNRKVFKMHANTFNPLSFTFLVWALVHKLEKIQKLLTNRNKGSKTGGLITTGPWGFTSMKSGHIFMLTSWCLLLVLCRYYTK